MAYYAALTSLLQTLEQIHRPWVHKQITSLQNKVGRSLVLLLSQKSSLAIQDLEGRIRDALYQAEDIIQSQIPSQRLVDAEFHGLEQIINEFGSILDDLSNKIDDGEVEDLQPRNSPSQSLAIQDLEGRIRDASYQAEDIIQSQIPSQRLVDAEFQGLEQIINEFGSILDDPSNKIDDGEVEDLQPRNSSSADSARFPASNEGPPVGLHEDLLRLKDRLTGSPSRRDVISIVGMGGIGKTTLARNLYNDSLVEQHFDIRAWVSVSQECHVREMLTCLVDSFTFKGDKLHERSIEQLEEHAYRSLNGWRYLIVMDDVWDTGVWDYVKRFFPDDSTGSRIILTTRSSEVALYANYFGYIHQMSLLSPEASWDLLHEKVFGNDCCPPELEDIGKRIAKNCKGLPLTIVLIGGLLYEGIKSQDYWEYTAENINSAISENDDQFMQILSLSYNALPQHLKPCFLYTGVFPEDSEIFVSHLIKLWIAEGFIEPQYTKSLEEVAKVYLEDLIDRSLIMVRKRKPNGEIKTCIVHDMYREMCLKKAQDEKFLQILNWEVHGFSQGRNNQRRVSVHSNIVDCLTDIHDSSVRSILYFCTPRSELLSFTMSCRLLRVFSALTIRFYEFPIEILELVHLKFLSFLYRGNNLPSSISKLQNLQTLIVFSVQLLYLPPTIWEMPKLRHLLFEESFLPAQIIWKNSVVLENLQTLSGVTNFKCTRKVLEMMPNLKKLRISYVYDADTQWSYYEFDNFARLHQLETLKCLFIPKLSQADRPLPVNLIAFPPNLKMLTLSGCRIPSEKMTVIGSLPNLEVLKLKDHAFEGSVWEMREGEFSRLKVLLIDMSFLEHWIVDCTHFPKLQHLSLSCCPKLAEIPPEMGEISTLEMIELYECSSSAVESAMRMQEEQRDMGNDIVTVRVHSHSDYYYSQQQTSLRKVHNAVSAW